MNDAVDDAEDEPGPVWIDGRLVTAGDAVVSVFDLGFTVGDGVFETCKVLADGTPFALDRHLVRLRRSLAVLDLELPTTDAELTAAVHDTIAANPGCGRLRITVSSGVGALGSRRGDVRPTIVIAAGPGAVWATSAHVVMVPFTIDPRSPTAGAKTISYAGNVVAIRAAKEQGGDEAIFSTTDGHLCEGAGSNVFVVRHGVLATPPLSSGCLAGVTRSLVLDLAVAAGLPTTDDEPVPASALPDADEAFLTSSTRDVHPIATVDGRPLPSCPGPITAALQTRFAALLRA